jgi:ComF family protein
MNFTDSLFFKQAEFQQANAKQLWSGQAWFKKNWPQHCFLCGARCYQQTLCPACEQELPLLSPPFCTVCATPLASTCVPSICGNCLRKPPAYHHTIAGWQYRWPLDRLIHAFKFHHQFSLLPVLAKPLLDRLRDQPAPDILIPMPLHPQRLRQRGYNQALLLAQHLSRQMKLPVLKTACQRTRHTTEQSGLSRAERVSNLRHAFICAAAVRGQHIALIDDVMTSGSSAHWLAQALLTAGASSVNCWILARTPPNDA